MMIGRAPTMVPPQQYAQQPMQPYPGPQQGQFQAPQPWPPPHVAPPPATAAAQLAAHPLPPITARGKPYEDPPDLQMRPVINKVELAPIHLPAPEELGVAPTATAMVPTIPAPKVDWNATHERIQRLGGVGLQTAQLSDGRFRVAFVLRTNQADQVHHIEAIAGSDAEAVCAALERAEQWASGR